MTVTNFAIHIWYNDSAGNLFAFTDPWALRTVRVTKTPFSVTNLAYLPFISLLLLKRRQFICTFTGKSTCWEGAELLLSNFRCVIDHGSEMNRRN